MLVFAAVVTAVPAAAAVITYGPVAAPQDPFGTGAPTSVRIIWWTDQPTSVNRAYAGAGPGGPWTFSGAGAASAIRHEVLITDLTSETRYYAYAESDGVASEPIEFRTGANRLVNGSFETWHAVSGQGWGAEEPDGWHGWEIYPWDPRSSGYPNHVTIQMDRATGVPSPFSRHLSHRASMDRGWRTCYGGVYQHVNHLEPGAYIVSGWAAWLFDVSSATNHSVEIIAKDGPHQPGAPPTGTAIWEQFGPGSELNWKYVQGVVQCTSGTLTIYANLRADSPDGGSFVHFDGFRLMAAEPVTEITLSNITAAVDQNTGISCIVSWNTNYPSTANRVHYRRAGTSSYSVVECAGDPEPSLSHSAALGGLELDTLYEYHVESGAPAMPAAVSSPDRAFRTPVQPGPGMYYGFALVGGPILEGGDDVGPGDDWERLMLYEHPYLTTARLGFASWAQCQPNDPADGPNVYDWSDLDRSIANAVPGKSRTAYYQMWGTSPGWVQLDTPRFWQKFEEFVEAQVIHINQNWGEVDIIFENEPNISRAPSGWHWADWYIHCLGHFHTAVHRANAVTGIPNKVIAGNLAGHSAGGYAELYARGLKNISDIIGTHPYPDNIRDGVKVEDLAAIRATMEQHSDAEKKIFITEGWGSGRSAGFDRSSPLIEPTAQEIENMWLSLAKGYDNLMTPRAHWDASCLWGITFFCANDNWGSMGWRGRAIPVKDGAGNITGFEVDGYIMTPDIAPYFWNGGMYDFYGNSKDALHLVFPGNGLVFMNPGFELKSEPPHDHTPHFWTTQDDPPSTAVYSLDDVIYRSGSRSLKLTRTVEGSSGLSQMTAKRSASAGVSYRARVWCRTEGSQGAAGRFYMRFHSLDGAAVSEKHWAADTIGAGDWTLMEVIAVAPIQTCRIEVGCSMNGVGIVRFDDVTISVAQQEEVGVVKGYTLDENQVPVPRSIVATTTGGCQTISDENGYYEIAGVPSGTYDFICRKPGYVPFRAKNQTVAAGKTSFVMFCMGIPKPGLEVMSVEGDAGVWPGEGGAVNVTAVVRNTSPYPVNLSDVGLFVEDGAGDATGRFTIHADPYNPRVIAAQSGEQFRFRVEPRAGAVGLAARINAYAFGQEDRPNMLINGGFDGEPWNQHWSFAGGATLSWSPDYSDYHTPPRSLKCELSSSGYTWNWANNYSAWGTGAIPAKPRTNYTIGCYHKDANTTPSLSIDLFIQEFYYDGSKWLYNGRRFAGVPKRSVWAHDCLIYLTGDPDETPGLYPTNRLVVSCGPCTTNQPASGVTWWDDLYLKETGDWLADDGADSGAPLLVPMVCASPGAALDQADGTAVQVSGLVVSAGAEVFADRIYVQSTDRTRGLLVVPVSSAPGTGARVTVTGVLGSASGERALLQAVVVLEEP